MALITKETEYIALYRGAKEVVFIRGLMEEFGFFQYYCNIFCSNQSAFMVKILQYRRRVSILLLNTI